MEQFIQGAFWGAAIGDALGGPLENMDRHEIKARHGKVSEMIGGGWLNLQPGQFTDDTQMMLMVAEGILANPAYPVEEIGLRFIRWYYMHPEDIGPTTVKSFENYLQCGNWQEAAAMTARSLSKMDSNGALMRTLPVTFAYWTNHRDMAFRSKEIASMTHYGDESTACCIFYNYLVGAAVEVKENKRDLITKALIFTDEQCRRLEVNPARFFWSIARAVQCGAKEIISQGKALETLVSVIQCFLSTDDFEEALVKVINLGGDTDTAGCVLGGLAGAYYGMGAIPVRWVEALQEKDRIARVADAFTELNKDWKSRVKEESPRR